MTEVEKLRALLAEAQKWVEVSPYGGIQLQGEHFSDKVRFLRRIDAALAEPVEGGSPEQTKWACYDCGSTGDFLPVQHPAGDYDVKCDGCGSTRTDEIDSAVRRLVLNLDTAQAERDEARAEVERLRTKAMMVIGDRYREGWMKGRQRGAEAMREAAAQVCDEHNVWGARDAIRALPLPEDKP